MLVRDIDIFIEIYQTNWKSFAVVDCEVK